MPEATVPETTVPETTVPETTVPETTVPDGGSPRRGGMSPGRKVEIRSWGGLSVRGVERLGEDLRALSVGVPLSRGLGRAYGDAALPPHSRPLLASTRLGDRILAFDPVAGLLHAEAGLSLGALNRLFWPRGFTVPVLPGTQHVSLGGMVAADVHGKNHHCEGTFGRHVERLLLRVLDGGPDGRLAWCSREREPALFRATLGSMGLIAHVLEVVVRLQPIPSPWIWAEHQHYCDLASLLAGLAASAPRWPFTVAWADCLLKRVPGVLFRGRWATAEEAPSTAPVARRRLAVPVHAPSWVLNRHSIRVFNRLVDLRHRWRGKGIVHPEGFFHPLDTIKDWNRIYGRRGLTQYQCVLPATSGRGAIRAFFDRVRATGCASFLTVVKDFGAEGEGLLSFPRPGTTVSLDLPVRPGIEQRVAGLNALVRELGGRIYLAKDAFTTAEDFRAMEPRLAAFAAARRRFDPRAQLASALSGRLLEVPCDA